MINFIICDDDIKFRDKVIHFVNCYMMKNKIEYKTHIFDDYDSSFMRIVEKKMSFKIYILDIETPTHSGIDVARIIRKNDVDSVLIFLTGHHELSNVVLKNDFLFLSFINKFDDCEGRLNKSLDRAFQTLKVKNIIRFKDGGVVYTIPQSDILYVTRDSIERKCIIVTDYGEFMISKNLNEIEELLDDDFVKTHRACIMNSKRIRSVSKSKKEVLFDNGMKSNLISTRFDEELI